MPPEPGIRGKDVWAAAALCGLILAAYSNSLHAGFVLDNQFLLAENRIHAATLNNLVLILRHTYWWPTLTTSLYRPVTTLSYLFNWAILGNADRPEGYHWVNLGLHALNTILAFAVGLRLTRGFRQAVLTAAVWAVHPLLTEAVTDIVGRADLLAAASILGGLLIYLKAAGASGRRRVVWLVLLAIVTLAGLSAKESAIMLPAVIVLYSICRPGEAQPGALSSALKTLVLPVALFLYQREQVLATTPPPTIAFVDNPLVGAGFLSAKLTAIGVMARYILVTIWPEHLSADYSYNQIPLFHWSATDFVELAVIALCVFGLAKAWRHDRVFFFWGAFAFLTFLPTSNLLFPIGTIMGERLLYLPSLGLIACAVLGVFALAERWRVRAMAPILLSLLCVVLMARTWLRNPDWNNPIALSVATVRAAPESFKSHVLLAEALAPQNPDAAIGEANRALAILGTLPDSKSDWSAFRRTAEYYSMRGQAGDNAKAIELIQHAIAILKTTPPPKVQPGAVVLLHGRGECYRALARACLQSGDMESAFRAASDAIDADSGAPDAYRTMARVLNARGNAQEAIVSLAEGEWLTGDTALSRDILAQYQHTPDAACATLFDEAHPKLNMQCEPVRKSYCAGASAAVALLTKMKRPETADRLRDRATLSLGCSSGP